MTNEFESRACARGGCDCAPAGGAPIDRRAMLSQSALMVAAAALAACGNTLDIPSAPTSVSFSMQVANFPALASVGGVTAVNANGSPIAVVRTGPESFLALSRICPHQGSTIGVFSDGFQCPRHGATFDTQGQWIGGQRTSNMRGYATTYTAATDTLQIG